MDNSASNKMTKSSIEKQNPMSVGKYKDCSKMDISVINNPRTLHERYQVCCPKTFGTFKNQTPICKQMDKKFKELMNAHYIAPSEVQYGYLKENGDPMSDATDQSVMSPDSKENTGAVIGGIKMMRKMTKKSSRNKKSQRNKKSFKKRKRSRKKRSRKTNK